jgi:DNA-binding XRE family transcriptional regulator
MRTPPRPTADEVRELRLTNGLTQKNLADLLCISIKTLQAYEQGRRTMPSSRWLLMYLCVPPTFGGHWPSEDGYSFVGDKIVIKQSP